MFTLRSLITSASNTTSRSLISTVSQKRTVGYLHRGSRVRGLVRDEADYLVSPKGAAYELNDTSIGPLKTLLGSKYALPDELLLQIQTHKSFAHGSKPFNEKIAVYGQHFLKYKTTLHTIETQGIDALGSESAKKLISTGVLADFVRSHGLADAIYWKKRNPLQTDVKVSGENSVLARTCEAIVGGILLQRGKETAEQFVDEVMLKGEKSLVSLSQ
ncbi:Ribonuclease 3 [Cyberlindnera fabianii]|uniref:Ribonuclease 3 n=1 Tax=Cyberlindnera fabianii TaxID=36022 RepID=A0A1V2L838_CYBFA|nr:Ribonuclease 3 [Cyberlindnera fabianii]